MENENAIETLEKLIPDINNYMDMFEFQRESLLLALAALREKAANDKLREQERLVVLPCKVGTRVYRANKIFGEKSISAEEFIISNLREFGRHIFSTREEAEKALEEGLK